MTILYEDNHIIAVNKSCSEIVQGDKTGDVPLSELVKQYLKDKYDKPGNVFLGVTHRIDRPTSGVVLFAKTSKALTRLNAMFQSHDAIKKTYWAIVANKPINNTENSIPELGAQTITLENYLIRNTKQNKTYIATATTADAKLAKMKLKRIAQGDNYSLLEIELLTGRHHQIRCQLAGIGYPIKGDLKYGAPRSNDDGGISLHARQIVFIHPVSKQLITITAPVPNSRIWHILQPAT